MSSAQPSTKPLGLVERLKNGGTVLIAEGYMWEFERRGYLQSGGFVPEVVLDHPEFVTSLHREYVHAGSDIVEAFTYYGHREKLRAIGREDDLERLNRNSLKLARAVADESGTLMAGNLCNSGLYSTDCTDSHASARAMFKEQVEWAVEEGADFIIAETFNLLGEALLALDVIKEVGKGLAAVVTLTPYCPDRTIDEVSFPEACRRLEEAGAAVVGLNCSRGPETMIPLIKEIRKVCKGPIAALPVPFRTNCNCKTFFGFKNEQNEYEYPLDLESHLCNRSDIRRFAKEAKEAGVQYIGLCCGNASNMLREVALIYGRKPPSCRFAPDLSKNLVVGETGAKINKDFEKMRNFAMGLVD